MTPSIGIVLIVLGLIALVVSLTSSKSKKPVNARSHRHSANSHRDTSYWANFLKYLRPQYVLGYLLLILALIYQSDPDVVTEWGQTVGLVEKPQPSQVESPWSSWRTSTLHPAVASMPLAVENGGIPSVAQYIAQQEPDPYLRIKALHDYVADRIAYDTQALETRVLPPQDAETVFRTKKAVCTGYGNLFKALGNAIGEKIEIIYGNVRQELLPQDSMLDALQQIGHAWSAVNVAGNWHLVDVTWDGNSDQDSIKQYKADYLMIPPEIIIKSHFPKNSNWQLTYSPLSEKEFEQQPLLTPEFFAEKLTLISPSNFLTNVRKVAQIKLSNPEQHQLMAWFVKNDDDGLLAKFFQEQKQPKSCKVQAGNTTEISCDFPASGTYQVILADNRNEILGQLKFKSL